MVLCCAGCMEELRLGDCELDWVPDLNRFLQAHHAHGVHALLLDGTTAGQAA